MDFDKATEAVRKGYNRLAPFYDFLMGLSVNRPLARLRQLQWSKVQGTAILEVGVGTGKNYPYYPPGTEMTAIDLSEGMLARARRKALKLGIHVVLQQMDVQNLEFNDDTFDTVAATFVFCTVPDPVRGLAEVKRVCKPGGRVVLLEHGLSDRPVAAWMMNLANPLIAAIGGENINRRPVDNVTRSGLTVEKVTPFAGGIGKLIEARKTPGQSGPRPQ